ncbi:pleckstrin homology domain-containing family B member 2 [Rhincodon typus]|uniref:pleckstrin homology domain-containing family B member 2 n=1 Tax=Rhincodon typus TaxID=259920 RepID=UPI0009A2B15C|nr:pleckstrin homology domain-containing family B member 2 [Rhincodon typus]XP_020371733.1 pleckstrin homology domain-containing family B member 2 [Rhincodon typus]XP_048460044.1 pleckstrin homology domain-containing family B member 2 [Rhincodon typus]XP_048460045.1 pleckstrin homology domain-containing family B member 2 [Rhincodon typus]XP_048460046.1 pleckstrin homology domain-containing family B member 2 [Rhincodon typus]
MADMAYIKSGWLLRQSTILKRWKNNWFDLWSNGQLIYYDNQMREDMEDKIHLKMDCINIRSGSECRDFQPPDGKPRDCLLQIQCRDERTINLCAESADDCLAWKLALREAWTNLSLAPEVVLDDGVYASAPPPYTSYPTAPAQVYSYDSYSGSYAAQPPPASQQVVYTSNGQPYAVAYQYPYNGPYPPPTNHVIIQDRRRDDGDLALGMVAGAATGMALGSLFWAF